MGLSELDSWLHFAWELMAFLVVALSIRGIVKAFKGGNGLWQIDEVSKLGIFVIIYQMVSVDSTREHEWMFFPVSLYVLLIFALLMMAKLEDVIKYFLEFIKSRKQKNGES